MKIQNAASITKALADENRLRLLMALCRQELCVCQLTELLGLALSTVSRHLTILRQAGLIEARKEGRWMYYQEAAVQAGSPEQRALDWVHSTLANDPQTLEDAQRLKAIVAMNPEDLCCLKTRK